MYYAPNHYAAAETPLESSRLLAQLEQLPRKTLSGAIGSLTGRQLAELLDGIACARSLVHHSFAVAGIELDPTDLDRVSGTTATVRRARQFLTCFLRQADHRYLPKPHACLTAIAASSR